MQSSSIMRVSEVLERRLRPSCVIVYKIKSTGSLSLRWQETVFWVRQIDRPTDRQTERQIAPPLPALSRSFFPPSFSHNAIGAAGSPCSFLFGSGKAIAPERTTGGGAAAASGDEMRTDVVKHRGNSGEHSLFYCAHPKLQRSTKKHFLGCVTRPLCPEASHTT